MKKIFVIALSAAALALSCEKMIEIPEENPAEPKMITVSCTIDDSATKVSLTNTGTVGKTAWEEGDKVFFHGKKVGTGYSYVATAQNISADGKTAQFIIPELNNKYDGGTYYQSSLFAIYPADLVEDYSDGDSWNYLSAVKETNHLLLAACNDFTKDEYSFTFFNLTGALSFKVDGSAFGGFDKYIFQGNNGETIGWGHHTVSFATQKSDGSVEKRYRYKGSGRPYASSDPKTTIVVSPSDPNWDNGTTVNTVFFPGTGEYDLAAANFSGGFTIKFYKNDVEVKRVTTNTPKNITVGTYLDLGDITSHLITYTPPATHSNTIGVDVSTAIDLSESATANSYIVEKSLYSLETVAGASFKFKAAKGKGGATLTNISADNEANDVVILWATQNTTTAPGDGAIIASVDYDLQSGGDPYIVFKMPTSVTYGNAVIAAKNSSGEILWSWHIWVPETKIGSGTYGFTPTMMDRNLGALVVAGTGDVRAVGLMYQWGRKDPFVGLGVVNSSTLAAVSGVSKSVSSAELTYDQSIKNPTTFSIAYSGSKYHWIDTYNYSLWGATKTENDPCPPGWRVPHRDETDFIFKSDFGTTYTYDATNYCVTIGEAVFPFNGRLYYTNGNISDKTNMYLWSSKCSDSGLARWLRATSSACVYADERAACGVGVRCIAE